MILDTDWKCDFARGPWGRGALVAATLLSFTHCAGAPARRDVTGGTVVAATTALHFRDGSLNDARAEAEERGVPVLIAFGASWCEPCRAMKASLFTDPLVSTFSQKFIWLAVDADTEQGKALRARFAVTAVPAVLVLDAKTSKPLLRLEQTVSSPELVGFLKLVIEPPRKDTPYDSFALAVRREATGGANADEAALPLFEEAMAHAPKDWILRPYATNRVLRSRAKREAFDECVEIARTQSASLPLSSEHAYALVKGMQCARAATRPEDVRQMGERLGEMLRNDAVPMLPFTRGMCFHLMVRELKSVVDASTAVSLRAEEVAFAQQLTERARTEAERESLAGISRRASGAEADDGD